MNEAAVVAASSDDFYATASSPCFVLSRANAPATITRRNVSDVVRQAG